MSFIDFTEKEIVNVEIIDKQHRIMAEMVNGIHDSVLKMDKPMINSKLSKLIEYVELHFETEEKLMKGCKYPGYFSHKLEHDRFYHQLLKSYERFQIGAEEIGTEQLKKLRRWFFNHIEINDKKCGYFFNSI